MAVEGFYNRERLGSILGDDDFIDDVKDQINTLSEELSNVDTQLFKPNIVDIVKAVSDYYGVSEEILYARKKGRGAKNQPRKLAMYLAQVVGDCRLTQIAEAFGLKHYGGVSNAISMIKQELERD